MMRCIFVVLMLVLGACSSGGGGSSQGKTTKDTRQAVSVSAESEQVSLTVTENQTTHKTISFDFVGDGMAALIPHGLQQPGWLLVDLVSEAAGKASFRLLVTAPPPPGSYTTTVRFAAVWLDTEEIDYVDVDIQLVVLEAPTLSDQTPIQISTYSGAELPEAVTVQLNDDRLASSVIARVNYFSGHNWLTVEADGSTFKVRPRTTALAPATYFAHLTLTGADDLTQTINIEYQLDSALGQNPPSPTFSAVVGIKPEPITLALPDGVDAAAFSAKILYGSSVENWLSVKNTDKGFEFNIVNSDLLPGQYGASVQITAGTEVISTVQVVHEVKSPFAVQDIQFHTNAISGAKLPQPSLLQLREGVDGSKIKTRIIYSAGAEDWLQFEPVAGGLLAKVSRVDLPPGSYSANVEFLVNDKAVQNAFITFQLESGFPSAYQPPFFTSIAGAALPEPIVFPVRTGVDPSAFTARIGYEIQPSSWLRVDTRDDGYHLSVTANEMYPGQYSAQIEFLLGDVIVNSVRVSYIVESPVFQVGTLGDMVLDNDSTEADLHFPLNIHTNSPLVSWRIFQTSPMLDAVEDNANRQINLSVDKTVLNYVASGSYEEWIEIEYSHPYLSQQSVVRVPVNIDVDFVEMQYAAPRVVYLGEETKVLVRGNQIGDQGITAIQVGDIKLDKIKRINGSELEVVIPASMPEGVHTFRIPKSLELDRDIAQVIVKPHAVYPTESVTLPSRVGQVVYDPAREQFHFTGDFAVYTLAHDGLSWEWSSYPIAAPASVALTQNGKKLLIGTNECDFWEISLENSDITMQHPPKYCVYEQFGFTTQFYTGLTVVANVDQWPSMMSYPTWGSVTFPYPHEHSPLGIASLYGTHMIWAGRPTTTGAITAYVFDARSQVFNTLGTIGENYYLDSLLSISANGNRISHFDDIYNAQLAYIGSVGEGGDDVLNRVGISPKGSLAGLFEANTQQLRIFEISGKAPFLERNYNFVLPSETSAVSKILFSEDDRYMFVFAHNTQASLNKMYIFELK